ncbi:glycosyltransferase [Agromyces seonyuensis]|uniref:Glycosyltransferase n=1 Tax=Agromyces seonyuensis TaxID=2662446 RepID=A0A6I4P7V6_9MICO|nr:glycosyltransferase [Agromyces seonyuensis]MWB99984.1 glycosyltransferase [Agromyces seonyuensis]
MTMRYLLAVWDGGGATPPCLGAARMLVERGHEVVVYGDPSLTAMVAATGAEHRTWPTAPQRASSAIEHDVLRDWEPRTPIGVFNRLIDRMAAGPADRFAADVGAALDAEHFDAVLADAIVFGALVAAEARGIPSAVLVGSAYLAPSPERSMFDPGSERSMGGFARARDRLAAAMLHRMWDRGLGALNAARASSGLDPLAHLWDQWGRADRVLMLTSVAFDDPSGVPDNVRYVGPVLEDLPADGDATPTAGAGALVVVGLSSSYMEQTDLLGRIARALASLPVRGVITTGPAIDPVEVPTADNLRIVRAASHAELFAHADLVITHAGHGTVIKALATGVPMVCVPLGRDQPMNAARVVRLGAGVRLSPKAGTRAIADAVTQALADPSYRQAAAAIAAGIQAEIASGTLLSELEGLAAVEPTPSEA